ncbi:MAG TPA: AarF/UbiB family protein [Dongiaceae bacterium]|nr:AarF/UbiB family protein [Dongiaceae bacterium]
MKFSALTRLERNVHRAGEIIGVLAKYGLADWVKGLNYRWVQDRIKSVDGQPIPDLKVEERARLAFTELGTTFIKLGQVLGTRSDLVGPEVARELAHLQTGAPADAPDTVRATIETEFGKPLSSLFAEFEDAPLASASIAQAHVARLLSGEQVVVKVQHAGIAARILPDLDILAGLAELEGTAQRLNPEFSLAELVRPFYTTMVRRRFSVRRILGRLQHAYRDWERLAESLPRDLNAILSRVRDGTFSIHLDLRHIDPVVNRLVLGVVTAALFLGSSLLWSMKAPPMLAGVSVFGGAGYLLAAYLGWRLLRAIKKSGDINSKK